MSFNLAPLGHLLRLPHNRPAAGEDRRRFLGAERGSLFSAHGLRAINNRLSKLDGFQHVVHCALYLLIPEPDDSIAPLVEIRSASSIFGLFGGFGVLTPVNFDDQAVGDTTKVNKVRTDAVLAAKFEPAEAPGSEVLSFSNLAWVGPAPSASALR